MKFIAKKSISLFAAVGIISSSQVILSPSKSNALDNHKILSKTDTLIKTNPEINDQKLISQVVVIPIGAFVTFWHTEGYPRVTSRYCGVVRYWNGGSYDIQVGNRRFNYVSDKVVILGC